MRAGLRSSLALTLPLVILWTAVADAATAHHRRVRPHLIIRPSEQVAPPTWYRYPASGRSRRARTEISIRRRAAAAEVDQGRAECCPAASSIRSGGWPGEAKVLSVAEREGFEPSIQLETV